MESSPVLLDAALILPTPTRLGVLIHSESETEGIQGEKSFHGTEIQLVACVPSELNASPDWLVDCVFSNVYCELSSV